MKKIMVFLGLLLISSISVAGTQASLPCVLDQINQKALDPLLHYVGEEYGGGIVFYIYDPTYISAPTGYEYNYPSGFHHLQGQHGLIAAKTDQSTSVLWSSSTTQTYATANGLGAGKFNTNKITSTYAITDSAALLCALYHVGNPDNDSDVIPYSDWYLPSIWELKQLYKQKEMSPSFSTMSGYYWSSVEDSDKDNAKAYNFSNGSIDPFGKDTSYKVRAIRAF